MVKFPVYLVQKPSIFDFFIDNQQYSIEYLSIIYVAYFTAQTSTKSEERNSINYLLKWSVSHTSDNLFKLKHKVGRYVNIATIVLFMKNPFASGSRALGPFISACHINFQNHALPIDFTKDE